MADLNEPEKDISGKRKFINEKVVKPRRSYGEMAIRCIEFICLAVFFGMIAAIAFAISGPTAVRIFGEETTVTTVPILIPKDEPESTSVLEESSTIETLPEETSTEATSEAETTEAVSDLVESAISDYQYTIEDYNVLYNNLRVIYQEADKGIVVVHSVKRDKDWFDNSIETTGLYSGAVIASTEWEIVILTMDKAVEEADSIKVTFADGTEVDGTIKEKDQLSGMAIVSVPAGSLPESTKKSVITLELGNSYSVKQGDAVIAVGAPAGIVHSSEYGFISYIAKNVSVTDGLTRVFYADMGSNARMGTFIMNLQGQLVGWVVDSYKSEGSESTMSAMAISDYKGILEKLTNGKSAAYLGITGQDVTEDMEKAGIPKGVYISQVMGEGPAYNAGIQSGDIMTKMGEQEITSMKEFQMVLESLETGEEITVSVSRNGREAYKDLEYQVIIGNR